MNKFLFITHITPASKRTAFRQALINIYKSALNAQTYDSWKVIVFGEEEKVDGRFNYFNLKDGTREEKFAAIKELFQRREIVDLLEEADYVIKLDDDDIISPVLLENLKNFDADLYYDRFHTFIDVSSGIITQQERPWVASTCVHKKEHILAKWNGAGSSPVGNLLYSDHSKAWHVYYESLKKIQAPSGSPVYLRVLSPSSITSGAKSGPPSSISDVSVESYNKYLTGFGEWKSVNVDVFNEYKPALAAAWKSFSGAEQKPLEIVKGWKSFVNRIFRKN